jgi:hypothetical protein
MLHYAKPPDDQKVEVRAAGNKGLGLFSLRDFAPGELILQWDLGRVVHQDDLAVLTPFEQEHLGELTATTCQILLAPRCYANHACLPTPSAAARSFARGARSELARRSRLTTV